MALVPLTKLLADAQHGNYAVGYFESWNLESLQAVMSAAEEARSPVIAGFNGGFLRHAIRTAPEKLAYYAGLRQALDESPAPVSFIFNESDSLRQIGEAIALGFNAVMPECEGLGLEEYTEFVRNVVTLARRHNVFVEAQVGRLASAAEGHEGQGEATDPQQAHQFVQATGIDALAVAVGNIHILTKGKAAMDLDVLRKIRERVDIPLVLHGGTGIPLESFGALIDLGVAKFNFGTNLKQAYLEAVKDKLDAYQPPMSPHPFLGMGGPEDIMVAGREAVKQKVIELMQALRSWNTVDLPAPIPRASQPV